MPPNLSRVISAVRAPRSAARAAASTPAGPAPITMTSIILGPPHTAVAWMLERSVRSRRVDRTRFRDVAKPVEARSAASKVNLQPRASQNCRVQILGAWLHDLQISRQVAPRSQGGVVEQLTALFVTLCKPGRRKRSGKQILEVTRQTEVKVTHAEGVGFPPGNEAVAADTEGQVPTNRIWVAI